MKKRKIPKKMENSKNSKKWKILKIQKNGKF